MNIIEEFKIGDTVLQKQNCSGAKKGKEYLLGEFHEGSLFTKDKNGNSLCSCEKFWEKLNKKFKIKPMKFIVTWDRGGDPHKLFPTKAEAVKYINEVLIIDEDIENINLYELGKRWKIETVSKLKLIN